LPRSYDAYGRGQGDLAQFMKSQLVPDCVDNFEDGGSDVGFRNVTTTNAEARSSGSSAKAGGVYDQRQSAAMLKPTVAVLPFAAAPSESAT
jgi:hypothetical protein